MISKKITALRQEKGLTQQAVAEAIGIASATYAHYESDQHKPDEFTLCKIAKFFNVSPDYLLGINDLRKPYVLSVPPLLYNRLVGKVNEDGFTPADIQSINPALANFMHANKISKIKMGRDDLTQSGLSAEHLEKLTGLIKQI